MRRFDGGSSRADVPVDFHRLDDVLAKLAVKRTDVVKMDIQGAEALALQGMRRTLTENAEIRLMIEYWPWGIAQAGGEPRSVLRAIRAMGFRIFEIDDHAAHSPPV